MAAQTCECIDLSYERRDTAIVVVRERRTFALSVIVAAASRADSGRPTAAEREVGKEMRVKNP